MRTTLVHISEGVVFCKRFEGGFVKRLHSNLDIRFKTTNSSFNVKSTVEFCWPSIFCQ